MLKTGIILSPFGYEPDLKKRLQALKQAGFDAFFTGALSDEDTATVVEEAARLGLIYDSVHAPFGGAGEIWTGGEKGKTLIESIKHVAENCARFGIPYFTMHCQNVPHFNNPSTAENRFNESGYAKFLEITEYAAKLGVKASYENVEFPNKELKTMLSRLRVDCPEGVAFTWDIGHEHCYPSDIDVPREFGDLIIGTHIHDNFGNTDPNVITWDDDTHVLPFDGTVDWRRVGKELKRLQYGGVLMIELGRSGAIPWYSEYTYEEWLREAHTRITHVARLCE